MRLPSPHKSAVLRKLDNTMGATIFEVGLGPVRPRHEATTKPLERRVMVRHATQAA
jgi:hypothetical protein